MDPESVRSSITSHHASGTHMISLFNQDDSGERHWQTCLDVANQNEA